MPELNKAYIMARLEDIEKQKPQKQLEKDKYMFLNGAVKPILELAIKKEFKKPESIEGLLYRLLPLNILKKIIEKLSLSYLESPVRDVMDGNESDIELMNLYIDKMSLDVNMKTVDQLYELNKKCLGEPYVNEDGLPALRILPAHTYYPFSESMICPEDPDCIVKVLKYDEKKEKMEYAFWTNERFLIVDGTGRIMNERMNELNNPEGVNPYGVLPFVYIVDSQLSVEPIQDDDLFNCSLSLPILLTDLSFASKYQAYSLLYTVDYDGEIPAGPGAVLHLTSNADGSKPSVNQIKPTVDVNATLQLIEGIVSYLLTSRGLKSSALTGKVTPDNAVSGVAKMIDNAEVVIANKDKQAKLIQFEQELWMLMSKTLIPIWRQMGLLNSDFNVEFSQTFKIAIQLQEPKAVLSEVEKIDLSKKKIDAGFSTVRRELMSMYPDFDEAEIEALMREIEDDKMKAVEALKESMMKPGEPMEDEDTDGSEA